MEISEGGIKRPPSVKKEVCGYVHFRNENIFQSI